MTNDVGEGSHASISQRCFEWREGGWTITTRRSKIHSNDPNSLQWKSHLVWKSELGMTRFRNQDLPEALWGSNLLQIHHVPTGTSIYFCALEALRSWALLDEAPIPHRSGRAADAWDYTFTTPYAGSTCRWGVDPAPPVIDEMIQPDGSSLYRAPAENPVSGSESIRLRPPLCKCVGGRMLCAVVAKGMEEKKKMGKGDGKRGGDDGGRVRISSLHHPSLPMERQWEPSDEVFDLERVYCAHPKPPLYYSKPIYFWVQNLDPQSYSFFMAHAFVGDDFLVASLRCFVRVNGVRVRLLSTQFIVRKDKNNEVLRERSWREGTWAEYTGLDVGNDEWIDLGTDLEQVARAQRRLKYKHHPVVEKLVLAKKSPTTAALSPPTTVWTKQIGDNSWSGTGIGSCCCSKRSGGTIIVLVRSSVVALDSDSGVLIRERDLSDGMLLLSAEQSKVDGKVVVGDDQGGVHILEWVAANAHPGSIETKQNELKSFYFRSKTKTSSDGSGENNRVQISSSCVERVVWSEDGRYFAAAAGREVMINGEIIEIVEGTVYDICFLGHVCPQLVVVAYGALILIDIADEPVIRVEIQRKFDIGASAILACAVSPDADSIAVGCLDRRVRVFRLGAASGWLARDWVGFDGRVSRLGWSPDGRCLAALGGSVLLVAGIDLEPGEAPILCSCRLESTGDSGDRFKTSLWGNRTNILMASTEYHLHIFDIHATNDMVPKRCYPIQSMPIEKGDTFVTNNEGEVVIWGRSNIRKIKIGNK